MMKRTIMAVIVAVIVVGSVAAQGGLKLPPAKRVRLANGLTLILVEQREIPLISVNLLVRGGAVADPAGKEGVADLTAELLRKGTGKRTAEQLAAELDFIGASFNAGATIDYSTVSAEFLKKDQVKGLDLVADAVLNSTLPPAEVEKLVRQNIDQIKAGRDRAQSVIGNYFNGYLYGSHPYGRPVGGDERSLAAITRDDLLAYYRGWYTPANAILAVAGDFTAAEMEKELTARFGAWSGQAAAPVSLAEPLAVKGKRLLLVDKPDSTQTFYQIGNLGIARSNADRVYINVINTLFGGRFTSMLNDALRVSSGLTYGANSFFSERRLRGPFVISTYTRNETTEKALDLTLEILKRLHEKGVTAAELTSAKNYLKGQFPPRLETTDQLAAQLAQLAFYGLDEREVNEYYARIDSMNLTDARRVIRDYFPLDNLVFVLVGKRSEIEGVVRKYAPLVDHKSITQPGF